MNSNRIPPRQSFGSHSKLSDLTTNCIGSHHEKWSDLTRKFDGSHSERMISLDLWVGGSHYGKLADLTGKLPDLTAKREFNTGFTLSTSLETWFNTGVHFVLGWEMWISDSKFQHRVHFVHNLKMLFRFLASLHYFGDLDFRFQISKQDSFCPFTCLILEILLKK